MTRERYNELKRVSKERYASEREQTLFIDGAEWSDSHPRKGLWDSEKVIGWLQDNADSYTWYDEFEGESGMTDNFIEDLKKAMEE